MNYDKGIIPKFNGLRGCGMIISPEEYKKFQEKYGVGPIIPLDKLKDIDVDDIIKKVKEQLLNTLRKVK